MTLEINLKNIKKVLSKIYQSKYKYNIPSESIALVKHNEEFSHYLLNSAKTSDGFYAFMNELCKTFETAHIVELGNREGLGVISIYEGIKEIENSKFTTIDIVNDLRFVPLHIKNSNKINFIFGNVLDEHIVNEVKNHGPIDILYLDTIHTAEQFEAEWNLYKPLLNKSAIILVDDIYYDTKHVFFEKINYEKFVDNRLHSSGFGVIIYNE